MASSHPACWGGEWGIDGCQLKLLQLKSFGEKGWIVRQGGCGEQALVRPASHTQLLAKVTTVKWRGVSRRGLGKIETYRCLIFFSERSPLNTSTKEYKSSLRISIAFSYTRKEKAKERHEWKR